MEDSRFKNAHARQLFDVIARGYEGPARVFSLLGYGRWRRFLVSRLSLSAQALVLDMCTGTGLVAMDMTRRTGCRVVGVDLADGMIAQAQRNLRASGLASKVSLAKGRAENFGAPDKMFAMAGAEFG